MTSAEVYEFGEIRVDRARMRIERAGNELSVEPKAYDVLLFLLDHRDRLVTKEELLETVWQGSYVTPNVLTRVVAQLRKALGDDAHEARYVQTVARRGYRFIAPVTVGGETPAGSPVAAPPQRSRISPWWIAALALIGLAGVAVLFVAMRDSAKASTEIERVTTRRGYNGQPAISPDGKLVAYVSDRTGQLEIVVTAFTPEAAELAVTRDGGNNVQPAWSSDGQWIAFHSRGRGGIWIVAATGGAARQVAEFGSHPSWAPDGESLVFESDSGAEVMTSVLWSVRRDGSSLRQLTKAGEPDGGHHHPSWSSSGEWIVFTLYRTHLKNDLCVMRASTGEITTLVQSGIVLVPQFADDDRAIYWLGMSEDTRGEIHRLRFDARSGKASAAPELVQALSGFSDDFSVAKDGTVVAGIVTLDTNLWAIDAAEDGQWSEPKRLTDAEVRNGYGNYSTTGKIAFVEMATRGSSMTTWLMNDDGSGREPLLIDHQNRSPQWSPDGRRVMLLYETESGESHFGWLDVATRRLTPLAMPAAGVESARLSPDGTEIAYYSRADDGVLNVWRRPLAGGPPRQVTFDRESASYPIWSPDGTRLAVEITRGADNYIAIVSKDGGPYRMLVTERGLTWPHSWSRDGKWIAFAGERNAVWNVYIVSVDTGEIRKLTNLSSAVGYVRYPSWSPDGRRIVFELGVRTGGVWALRTRR